MNDHQNDPGAPRVPLSPRKPVPGLNLQGMWTCPNQMKHTPQDLYTGNLEEPKNNFQPLCTAGKTQFLQLTFCVAAKVNMEHPSSVLSLWCTKYLMKINVQ